MKKSTHFICQIAAACMLTLGFAQFSTAGVVGTADVVQGDVRADRIARVQNLIAEQAVADQFEKLGIAPATISERVASLTDAELLQLETRMDEQVAGADAVGIIGAVFLVLLILELVGVTDIFKSL